MVIVKNIYTMSESVGIMLKEIHVQRLTLVLGFKSELIVPILILKSVNNTIAFLYVIETQIKRKKNYNTVFNHKHTPSVHSCNLPPTQ